MNAFFQDKVVIVTGASSGIGLETALAFAREGARVVLAARTQAKLQEVVDAHPDLRERLLIVPADVTKDEDVRRLIATTIAQLGRVDILVNNAGIGMRASIAETPPDDARSLMEVNFFGPLRCIQAVLPQMRQQGAGQIVNVGSIGQPRDLNPRASFGLYDSDARTVNIVRFDYAISRVQEKIVSAHLPEALARRLLVGR